jgi:hypothetical protein
MNHGKQSMNAGVAARHVARMVEDLICLKYDNRVSSGRQPRESRWRRPDLGWVKVNTDSSFLCSTGGAKCWPTGAAAPPCYVLINEDPGM